MKKENKALIKKFKVVIEDLLDNYEKYTEEEKAQVKEVFQKVADLNDAVENNTIYLINNPDAEIKNIDGQYFIIILT